MVKNLVESYSEFVDNKSGKSAWRDCVFAGVLLSGIAENKMDKQFEYW